MRGFGPKIPIRIKGPPKVGQIPENTAKILRISAEKTSRHNPRGSTGGRRGARGSNGSCRGSFCEARISFPGTPPSSPKLPGTPPKIGPAGYFRRNPQHFSSVFGNLTNLRWTLKAFLKKSKKCNLHFLHFL